MHLPSQNSLPTHPVSFPVAVKKALSDVVELPVGVLFNTAQIAFMAGFSVTLVLAVPLGLIIGSACAPLANLIIICTRPDRSIETIPVRRFARVGVLMMTPAPLMWGGVALALGVWKTASLIFSRNVITGLAIASPIIAAEYVVRGESRLSNLFKYVVESTNPTRHFLRALLRVIPRGYGFETLSEALNFWNNLAHTENKISMQDMVDLSDFDKENLRKYLCKLTTTADYLESKQTKINLAKRIMNVLPFIAREDFRELAFITIHEYLASCGDGIILSLEEIETAQELHLAEATAKSPDERDYALIKIGKKVFYKEKIGAFVQNKLPGCDMVEKQLAIQIGLANRLSPPLNTQHMLYYAFSCVTNADIDQAYEYIQTEYEQNFGKFLENWFPWEQHQRPRHVRGYSQLAKAENPPPIGANECCPISREVLSNPILHDRQIYSYESFVGHFLKSVNGRNDPLTNKRIVWDHVYQIDDTPRLIRIRRGFFPISLYGQLIAVRTYTEESTGLNSAVEID